MKSLLVFVLVLSPAFGDVEDRSTEAKTFSGAGLVIVDNVNGSIDVTGQPGNSVKVEVKKRIVAETAERLEAAKREVKLDMEQTGDTVKVYVDGPFRCDCSDSRSGRRQHSGYQVFYDFKLTVPAAARIDLYTVNHGTIVVNGVAGDFDIGNVNGPIEVTGTAGSGKAHTVNGAVKVQYATNPKGESSFETINGDVDITLQHGLAADARVETMHGGIYTDFKATALPTQVSRENKRDGFVYKMSMSGIRIGNGGVPLRMKTLNGDIFIRESGAR